MATYLRMLRYLRPYWRRCLAAALCIAVYPGLSGLSVLAVSRFIRILFEPVAAPGGNAGSPSPLPRVAGDLQKQAQAWVERQIHQGDRVHVLEIFCLAVLGLF